MSAARGKLPAAGCVHVLAGAAGGPSLLSRRTFTCSLLLTTLPQGLLRCQLCYDVARVHAFDMRQPPLPPRARGWYRPSRSGPVECTANRATCISTETD